MKKLYANYLKLTFEIGNTNTTDLLRILFNSVSNNILIRQVAGEESANTASNAATNLLSERRSRRRRYTFWEEDCESHDELINPQDDTAEYFDFRTYPLNINWKDLDSLQNDAYEIKEESGLVAVSIYFAILANCFLGEKAFKITPEKFVPGLAEFYFECWEKADAEALCKISELVINCFPENEKIILLIGKNLIAKKELNLVKLVLDLRLHYFLNFDKLNLKAINSVIRAMKAFYKFVPNETLKNLHEKLKEDKVLKKYYNEGDLHNFPKKSNYFVELKRIKADNNDLFGGIEYQKFYM